MLGHRRAGYSPAVAARLATVPPARAARTAPRRGEPPAADLPALRDELRDALHGLDEAGAEAALDRLLAALALDTVLRDVVLPFLADLGEAWARGTGTVGPEHFAPAAVAGPLHALRRGPHRG